MKRFTATEKWEDPWFRKLSPEHKCFWEFLCDRCDAAGVWKVDLETAEHFIGSKLDEGALLKSFGDRIQVLENGRWWIKKFIEFQYGSLSKECKPHIPVIRLLERHGINFETLMKGYAKGINTLEEKETYKEKEKKGSAEGGISTNPTLPEVQTEASMRAITPECAESFWNKHEGRGWVDGQGQPIRDWRPLLRNWATTWRANESKAKSNGQPEKPPQNLPVFTAPRRSA